MTHTPGPWTAGEIGYDASHAYECATVSAYPNEPGGPYRIAFAEVLPHFGSQRARAEAIANARLIAAAPEMLEACKRAVRFIDATPGSPADAFCDDIRAAIAKAEA